MLQAWVDEAHHRWPYPARTGAIEPLRVIHPATSLTIVGTPITTLQVGQVVTLKLPAEQLQDATLTTKDNVDGFIAKHP